MEKELSPFKQIIVKLFCLHEMIQTDSVHRTNTKGEVVEKSLLYKCTKCGNLKKIEI